MDDTTRIYQIPADLSGSRLDVALTVLMSDYSRARIQQWIKQGLVELDGEAVQARTQVTTDQQVSLRIGLIAAAPGQPRPQRIPFEILYEDDQLIVIDKPAGLVVHPGAGNPDGTLQNAVLFHAPELAALPRYGIVHRLDKDTSGILVVARTEVAHKRVTEQLSRRSVSREYMALVHGRMISGGTIDKPLGRHARDRKRMAVVAGKGREAITHYRVGERYRQHTLVSVRLETGRTHQIRAHLAHIGFPVVGDPMYGTRRRLPANCTPQLRATLEVFRRQALHARGLTLVHPTSGEPMAWQVPPPADFEQLRQAMEMDALAGSA